MLKEHDRLTRKQDEIVSLQRSHLQWTSENFTTFLDEKERLKWTQNEMQSNKEKYFGEKHLRGTLKGHLKRAVAWAAEIHMKNERKHLDKKIMSNWKNATDKLFYLDSEAQ